ncbi:MAG: hypothetical protein ACOX7H_09405, partial [Bacillota bacterium]
MKYMRKTPVEAIQWNPDNRTEFDKFVRKYTEDYTYFEYLGNILLSYCDFNAHKHVVKIPKFGWVVREGKTFQFYKNATFRTTFDEVQEDGSKGIDWEGMNKTIKEAFDGFDEVFKDFNDVFGAEPSKKAYGVFSTMVRLNNKGRLAKFIDDLYNGDEKTREEIKKQLSNGLKEMEDSDKTKGTESDTFESVLDEMKELHAKKDKDYGSAFHKSFEEFGVTAGVVRLNDKMERVKSLVKNGKAEVKDESLLDSLKDAACYAV